MGMVPDVHRASSHPSFPPVFRPSLPLKTQWLTAFQKPQPNPSYESLPTTLDSDLLSGTERPRAIITAPWPAHQVRQGWMFSSTDDDATAVLNYNS